MRDFGLDSSKTSYYHVIIYFYSSTNSNKAQDHTPVQRGVRTCQIPDTDKWYSVNRAKEASLLLYFCYSNENGPGWMSMMKLCAIKDGPYTGK